MVVGPPGSGKSTYCKAMKEFLTTMGRKVEIINMDPANDELPYECKVNISDLITVSDVMESLTLGPNGGLMYCMEYIETNLDWLISAISKLSSDTYILIDCPGQVELYTHHKSVRNILDYMTHKLDYRLAAVHLVDSHYCTESSKFISVLLTSLSTMLQIEMPHINILSKVDLIEHYGKLDFNIDFYTDVLDLHQLIDTFEEQSGFMSKFKKLNEKIVEVVENYGLVTFIPLTVKDEGTMGNVMTHIDKANGYIYGKAEDDAIRQMYSAGTGFEWDKIATVREKYMNLDNTDLMDTESLDD